MTTSASAWPELQAKLRKDAGMSISELAEKSGVARPNVSAYENGRRSPTFGTAQKIAEAAGTMLAVPDARPRYSKHYTNYRRPFWVPDRLPSLSLADAFRSTTLPIHIFWSGDRERVYSPGARDERVVAYQAVMAHGDGSEIDRYIDGALLIDVWDEIVLPREILTQWEPLVLAIRNVL